MNWKGRRIWWSTLSLMVLAAAHVAPKAKGGEVTRREAIQIAEAYRTFAWTATEKNVFHGKDRAGVRVDTPDAGFRPKDSRPGWWIIGQANVGVPYQWGGFSSVEEFARGVAAGRYAGDVYTLEKRQQLDDAVSVEAVGIDCSGLISRCWKLEWAHSTKTLPGLCQPLASYEDLRPGDILNTENNHVLLFKAWKDTSHKRLLAYETGAPPTWKVMLDDIPIELLQAQKYRPFRYRLMRE